GHAAECARRASELALDDGEVVHEPNTVRVGLVMRRAPGRDAAHDEELLARLDEPEASRLAEQFGAGAARRDPQLELLLLGLEPRDLRLAPVEDGLRVLVAPDRLP